MMRPDEPTRHGRAADALIASYVRELLADEPAAPTSAARGDLPELSATQLAGPSGELTTDATA